MSHNFGFSEAANLAVHSCALLAAGREDGPLPAHGIASVLGVSESHLRKVLLQLVRNGILRSGRGAAGGFELAEDPAELTLRRILEAVDSMPVSGSCLLGRPVCPAGRCVFTELTGEIGSKIDRAMSETTLETFAGALRASEGGMRDEGSPCDGGEDARIVRDGARACGGGRGR